MRFGWPICALYHLKWTPNPFLKCGSRIVEHNLARKNKHLSIYPTHHARIKLKKLRPVFGNKKLTDSFLICISSQILSIIVDESRQWGLAGECKSWYLETSLTTWESLAAVGTFVKMHLVKSVFDEIEKILHFARLPLSVRKHKYYIRCKDTKPIEAKW